MEEIIKNIHKKLDSMSKEDQISYLKSLGFKFKDKKSNN